MSLKTTSPAETFQIHEQLVKSYGQEAIQPCCRVCGERTEYIVEQLKPCVNGSTVKGFLLMRFQILAYPLGELLYIPVRVCVRCDAKYQAQRAFKIFPPKERSRMMRLEGLTDEERKEYVQAFHGAVASAFAQQKQDAV